MQLTEFIFEKAKFIGLTLIIGLIFHGILGRPRWQYSPIYALVILCFLLIILYNFKLFDLNSDFIKWILSFGIIMIISSIILSFIFPLEKLPKPKGIYHVGTRTYNLEDKLRNEIYGEAKDGKRKIKYQIWYPTEETKGYKKAKWISEGKLLTRQLAKSMHLPFFMLDHTVQIDSNSYYKAPLKDDLESYPVVIISHGWRGFRELHTDFAEELASNGFIAVSIDHTYGSQAIRFEDNTVAYLNKAALPREDNPGKYNYNSRLLVSTYGEDVASVLNDLEKLNLDDRNFKGRLDLEKVGLLGHSTGGGGDVYISLKDKRIKSVLGLDAWVYPIKYKILKESLSIPSLFLGSEQWSKEVNINVLDLLVKNSENSALIQMNETNHVDFSMVYMYSPLTKYIGFTGKSGGRYSSEIQKEFILSFFNESLRNEGEYNKSYLEEIVGKYDNLKFIDID